MCHCWSSCRDQMICQIILPSFSSCFAHHIYKMNQIPFNYINNICSFSHHSLKTIQVVYLEPGQSFNMAASNGSQVNVKATAGPVLGPPWQRPENGYAHTPSCEFHIRLRFFCMTSSVECWQIDFLCIKFYCRYLVTSPQGQLTLYLEPHCVYDKTFLEKERADIVITPVIKQLLPSFTLVSGQEDAVQLAKTLCAKYVTLC